MSYFKFTEENAEFAEKIGKSLFTAEISESTEMPKKEISVFSAGSAVIKYIF